MTPDEARRAGALKLGGLEADERALPRSRARCRSLERAVQDVRFAVRMLRKNPGFALDRRPDARARHRRDDGDFQRRQRGAAAAAAVRRSRPPGDDSLAMARTFRGIDSARLGLLSATSPIGAIRPARSRAQAPTPRGRSPSPPAPNRCSCAANWSSPSLFGVLGVEPALGRSFRPEEEQPGRPGVVILSDGFWRQQLGGDPNVLGRTLTIDGCAVHRSSASCRPAFHIRARAEREQLYAPLRSIRTVGTISCSVIGRMRRRRLAGADAQRISARWRASLHRDLPAMETMASAYERRPAGRRRGRSRPAGRC